MPPQRKLPYTCLVYIPVKDPGLIQTLGFYRLDVAALTEVFDSVVVETKLWPAIRSNADIAYVWWWTRSLPFLVAWKARRKRCATTGATDFRMPGVSRSWRIARVMTTAVSGWLSDANIAISVFEARDLAAVRARKRTIIPPAIEFHALRPGLLTEQPSGAIIAQMNPGSIHRKGVALTLEAMPRILRDFPNFHLHLIGPSDGPGDELLRELTREIPKSNLTIHGLLSERQKLEILGTSWVYFQPSSYEGFGLALAEAIACGAYPLSTGETATAELLTGICEPVAHDSDSVAEECVRILESPLEHSDQARERRATSMDRFSVERKSDRLRQVFKSL